MSLQIKPRECTKNVKRNNHKDLPKSIRGLIVGKSGCGKTTLMMNLLTRPGWLDYSHLMVFGKALYQPEYKFLKTAFDAGLSKAEIDWMFDNMTEAERIGMPMKNLVERVKESRTPEEDERLESISSEFYDDDSNIPDPSEVNGCHNNLIIFDDCMLGKQNKIESYYTRSRHNNVDCFYLSQNYFRLPRQTIRENSNFICLFKQDLKNINHIYQDHCAIDMSIDEFRGLCANAWSKPYSFLCIDLTKNKENGKYKIELNPLLL